MVKKHDSQSFSPLGWRQPSLGPSWNLKKAVFTNFAYFSLKQVQQISFESLIMGVKLIMGESNDYFLESKSRSNVSGEIFNWFSKFSLTKKSFFTPLSFSLFVCYVPRQKIISWSWLLFPWFFVDLCLILTHTYTQTLTKTHTHTSLSPPLSWILARCNV